jgi:hypothetical protein
MMKRLLAISLISSATLITARAHPGHEGHEDWPFPDIQWSMIAIGIGLLLVALYSMRPKRR